MDEKRVLDLIKDYVENNFGLNAICEKYHIGKLKVKDILKSNNIELKRKGKQSLNKNDFIVKDFHIRKYEECDGYHYIAIDKNDGTTFNDYMNDGGFLTTHIKNKYNIEITSLYERK